MNQTKHYKCSTCDKEFTRADNLKRHQLNCGDEKVSYPCSCGKKLTRQYNLKLHQRFCRQQKSAEALITHDTPNTHDKINIETVNPANQQTVEAENTEATTSNIANNSSVTDGPDHSSEFNNSFEEYAEAYTSDVERDENDMIMEKIEAAEEDDWACEFCNKIINVRDKLRHLQSEYHKEKALIKETDDTYKIDSCFGDKVVIYRITNNDMESLTVQTFLFRKKPVIMNLLRKYAELHKAINYQLEITTTFVKPDLEGGTIEAKFYINHKYATVYVSTATNQNEVFGKEIDNIFDQLCHNTEEIVTKGSNWALSQIHHIDLHINKKVSLTGGAFIDLPTSIKAKKACINPKNHDQQCFKWCILAYFLNELLKTSVQQEIRELGNNPAAIHAFHEKLRRRLITMSQADQILVQNSFNLTFDHLTYPTKLDDLQIFADLNPDINLNVFGISAEDEKRIVGPLFATYRDAQYDINLLYLSNEEEQSHFCWIKDLSRFAARERKSHRNRQYYCQVCLLAFNSEDKLKSHKEHTCLSKLLFNCALI